MREGRRERKWVEKVRGREKGEEGRKSTSKRDTCKSETQSKESYKGIPKMEVIKEGGERQ